MKNITKRKDGRYMGRFTHNKKRYFVYDTNKKTCYKKLIELKTKLTGEIPKHRESPKTNFFDFAKMWFEKFKKYNLKDKTRKMYETCLKHFEPLNKDFKEIKTLDIQILINKLGNTRTKEIAYMTLNQIFKKAIELKVIKENLFIGITKGKIERQEKTSFTIEEQKKILSNLQQDKFTNLILFYLLTGVRKSEAITFKKENIKDGFIYIEGTKTKNAKRFIKISKEYQKILESYNEEPFKFSEDYISKKFREFLKELGIKGNVHKLRHTFSTNLHYLGASDKERQTFLGHSSSVITNDIYTHLDPTIKKEDIVNLYKGLYPCFWHQFWHHEFSQIFANKKSRHNI